MAQATESRAEGLLESLFKLSERGTTPAIEARAGLATFLVMVYIVFLNPIILEPLGFDPVAVAAGTALAAGILSIAMGVYSNYPVAMAVGLGINAAVAFQLVIGAGLTPQGAMGVIVWEGIVVTVLVLAGLRERVMKAVPNSLKLAIAVGDEARLVTFEAFEVSGIEEVPVSDLRDAELVLEMGLREWNGYLKKRKQGKGPTLLSLDLENQVVSAPTPLAKLKFSRYNRSLQAFVDACARYAA